VEAASLVERGIRESAAASELKRQLKQQTSSLAKNPSIEYDSKPAVGRNFPPVLGDQKTPCIKCGKLHMGDCKRGSLMFQVW